MVIDHNYVHKFEKSVTVIVFWGNHLYNNKTTGDRNFNNFDLVSYLTVYDNHRGGEWSFENHESRNLVFPCILRLGVSDFFAHRLGVSDVFAHSKNLESRARIF